MIGKIKKLLQLLAVSRAVLFGVLAKVWMGITGAVTIILIASHFSPELQGYYFTFYSLLALQMFVELGMTTVIINNVSHEWADLGMNAKGEVEGSERALSRLKSLATVTLKWYLTGAVLLFVILCVTGYIFFSASPHPGISWKYQWFSLSFFACLNLIVVPAFSILEGCNLVEQVYFFRLTQEVVRSVALWSSIILGAELWVPTVSTSAMALWAMLYLAVKFRTFFVSIFSARLTEGLDWWREVWPMQWRIAVSWFSGYFCFNLFTPVLFRFRGPVIAGQMGMTWNMVLVLTFISSMWVGTRAPQFGILISKRMFKELDSILKHSAAMAVAVAGAGAVAMFAFVALIYAYSPHFAARFLPLAPTSFILAATVIIQVTNAQAVYLRAHKQEPLMWSSLIAAVATTLMVVFFGRLYGAMGVAVSLFIVQGFITLPLSTYIWFKCRKDWHSDRVVDASYLKDGGL